MKILEKVLKNKLQLLGFDVEKMTENLKQMDFGLIENQIAFENEADNYIQIKEYTMPTVEIARTVINYDKYYIQSSVLAGQINLATTMTSINSALPTVNYKLSEKICIVATTIARTVEVIIYNPSVAYIQQYGNQNYEEAFSTERNKIVREYYEAFVENGRVTEPKVKSILSLLLSEYIVDEIAITGENPRIKMYDTVEAYAENITEYRLKYINRRTNRIELAHKPVYIKRLGMNVEAGLISNDPYIKLDNMPEVADFPLNTVSCYWTEENANKKSEVAIYIASRQYPYATYREYYANSNSKYEELINSLIAQFQKETGKEVRREYVLEILKKLNPELLYPSMAIIRDSMANPADPVEPLRYKFKATSIPEDFEDKLYISIEDNMGRRYKYKLTENILEDLTRIGNKLEYTGEDGNIVRKQSIADFNINSSTAIIRRETIIDHTKIPGLLGYIYEDLEDLGTDMLPVPTIEVDFYFPQTEGMGIAMFNGTSFDSDLFNFSSSNKFNEIGSVDNTVQLPGATYATVRYVNSRGEVLKENKVNNLFPGTQFVPEILPIINDVNGGEWVCSTTQYPTTTINILPEYNVVEIKYKEKTSKVRIAFLNREGKKLRDDLIEVVQVGTLYDIESKNQYVDENKNEWKLVTSRPQKLLVKDDESKNDLILVYDIERETVTVKYLNSLGEDIIMPKVSEEQIDRVYTIAAEKILVDRNGLGWVYNGKLPITHMVREGEENLIEIKYEEYKVPVVVKTQSEDGITILNDKTEFLQVGTKYTPQIDNDITDLSCRRWIFKSCDKSNFVVSKDEKENVITVLYEPKLARVSIQILNEFNKKLLNPIEKFGQIGTEFSSQSLDEIIDNYGKMWKKKEEPNVLVVSQNEAENNITIIYEPLISTITVKFFDDVRNELIPNKTYERQAGTLFKPEIIEKLESADGRMWFFDKKKAEEIAVKKNVEENIVSIFYEKELADVKLEFVNAYGKTLRDKVSVRAQIGSVFDEKMYNRITDKEGGKWMLESTEPKKLVVKSNNNHFKLLYDEVKAIVIVRHINVKTNKTVFDDVVTKVRLGGVYIPNIREKAFDTDKLLWKFVGDKNISIVVSENEQENLVILQYDEALAKVNVKYQDTYHNKIRDDITYELQIGKDIDHKKLDKFIDINGMGWKIESSKAKVQKVMENESENEVLNIYDPLKAKIKVNYLNDKNEVIKESTFNELQVGRTFKPVYDDRVKDATDKLWKFSKISAEEVKTAENGNTIDVSYVPVLSNVTQKSINKTGEIIGKDKIDAHQVGSVLDIKVDGIYVDEEKKKWNFIKSDRQSIKIKEDETQNIVNNFYEPRMSDGIIKVYDDSNNEIMQEKKYTAQIGSSYTAEVPLYYIDPKTKLGWTHSDKPTDTIIVNDEPEKNVISVHYDKHMMTVKDRTVDMSGNVIIPDVEKTLQVGTTYEAKISDEVTDEEGKVWIYNGKKENKFIGGDNTSIVVSDNEEKNIVFLKYKPLMTSGVIHYQDNLGNVIASREEFKAQVGSKFTPEIKKIIMDIKKNKWVYNPNSKSTIVVNRDSKKNNVILSYEEKKAPVVYKYQDEYDNRLKAPKKVLAQIGSIFTPDAENVIEDEHGKVWEFKAVDVDKIDVKENEQDNVIVVTYIPLLVDAIIYMKNRKDEIISKVTQKAQLGSTFKPDLDENIYDEESMMFRLVKCEPQEILVKEVPIGAEDEINVFNVTYEPVYSDINIVYQDISGNSLKDNDVIQLQVGTKYTPKLVQFVKDRNGIQWENIFKEVDTIRVKENPKENIIKMTFELAKAEVMVRFRDMDGNTIKEPNVYQENIGTEFVPKVENVISDDKNRKWIFSVADPVKINVGSINNIINLIYQEKKAPVTIKFETVNGKKLREDMRVSVQEGVQFVPMKNFAVIYDENDVWRYLEFRPSSLLVTDNVAENVIIQVYDNKVAPKEEKNKLENPFANTLTEEEQKQIEKIEKEKAEQEEKMKKEKEEAASVNKVEFTESNLIELSKNVLLEDSQKTSIIKLNQINKNIVEKLDSFRNSIDFSKADGLVHEVGVCMQEEKELIEKELLDLINSDKTGKKFMKVLEAIVKFDKNYTKLQERKGILLTDYFINSNISSIEQANYICERGKNNKELLVLEQKLQENRKDEESLKQLYVELLYEKAMLDNYYKTRTKSKDGYFENEAERSSIPSEIVIMVTNMLPKQAYNLLMKGDKLNLVQENELDAIMNLLTEQQRSTLDKMVEAIKDNKMKKAIIKRLKDIR